jgi:hypothetical protein
MNKNTLFNIANRFRPILKKQNTKYKKTILVEIRICYVIYKLI